LFSFFLCLFFYQVFQKHQGNSFITS
jgi:hypothetical protein